MQAEYDITVSINFDEEHIVAELEIETTYLAATLPDLTGLRSVSIVDTYFPVAARHPKLRLRSQGGAYTLTKKTQLTQGDASVQSEENVALTQEEYEALVAGHGKSVSKVRYYYPLPSGSTAEVDVFSGDLTGLVLVDVEFASLAQRDEAGVPSFCGANVTQEDFIAGGMLAGATLADLQPDLDRLGYRPLAVPAH